MKATINGITYEGTPKEISAMMLIHHADSKRKQYTETEKSAFIEEMKHKQQISGSGSIDCLPAESYRISNSGKTPAYLGEYICYNGQ